MKLLSALAVTSAICASAATAADYGAKVGELTCTLTNVENAVIYTNEEFDCQYKPNTGDPQSYKGVLKSVGLNLSVTKDATLVWGVLTGTKEANAPDFLKGIYAGGTAKIAIGGGAAANILIGGSLDSIALQPFSVSGVTGYGAALDVASFELK